MIVSPVFLLETSILSSTLTVTKEKKKTNIMNARLSTWRSEYMCQYFVI